MIIKEVDIIMKALMEASQSTSAATDCLDETADEPPLKTARLSLFASYNRRRRHDSAPQGNTLSAVTVATSFVEKMVSIASRLSEEDAWKLAQAAEYYSFLSPLLEKLFCVPASSAPVERVFSHGGIIMRPHRARLGDDMLSALVYLKCNENIVIQLS